MNSNVSDFFLELTKNPELLEKFKGKSTDECYEIATKEGKWDFTKEEFFACLEQLLKQENLVDDESLNNISGGLNANQYSELFADFAKLFGDAGYLYGAIAKFKSKLEKDEMKDLKKQQEALKKIISEEKQKNNNT